MTYITGTITDANPGVILYNEVATALTSAGYTSVDTVVIGTRTHKIWKSPAASNAANLDWYLDVAYSTTGTAGGGLAFIPFEFYDATTDLAYRGPMDQWNSGGSFETTYYTRAGATGYSLEHANWVPKAGTAPGSGDVSLILSTSAFGYWISITPNRVIGMSSTEPTSISYTGLYTPSAAQVAHSGAYVFPLVVAKLSAGGTRVHPNSSNINRGPKTTGMSASGIFSSAAGDSVLNTYPTPLIPSGTLSISPTRDLLHIPLICTETTPSARGVWGELIDLRVAMLDGTVVRGDTITVGADTWVLNTQSVNKGMAFKAI